MKGMIICMYVCDLMLCSCIAINYGWTHSPVSHPIDNTLLPISVPL